jgi:hypothetical protein
MKGAIMPITFGRVPHPPFRDRLIPNANTIAWDDLGQRNPVGVVFHTMVGSLWGTDRYFRDLATGGSKGLTDYGIGGSADGPEWDGVILRWNDPRGRRSGWANGGSDGLEGDGPAFVRALGINAINRDLVSIERSDGGDISTPLSPKQFESLCQLTAYWLQYAIPEHQRDRLGQPQARWQWPYQAHHLQHHGPRRMLGLASR